MKKSFLFFVFLWMGFMGASAQGYTYDVNHDNNVSVTDVMLVVNKILGKNNPGDVGGGEAVDLGLPSGTLWSSVNIGASRPEEFGHYYAWGETEVKSTYNQSSYKYYKNYSYEDIGSDISGTQYDVATVLWGEDWCMPSKQQSEELLNNCTLAWTTENGVQGCKFTSKTNGKSIFIPEAGYKRGTNTYKGYAYIMTSTGIYSSSNAAFYSLGCNGSNNSCETGPVYDGTPVRPVRARQKLEYHETIDLGLPSGTKWASCNVGASSPEESGGYYAWGETEEKWEYTDKTYMYYDAQNEKYIQIGNDISGTQYDVAHVKWGGNWRMPTEADIDELLQNTTSIWTTQNGVTGRMMISKINFNRIFLPVNGCYESVYDENFNGALIYRGLCWKSVNGYYWSSTYASTAADPSLTATELNVFSDFFEALYNLMYSGYQWDCRKANKNRSSGLNVRPVYKE